MLLPELQSVGNRVVKDYSPRWSKVEKGEECVPRIAVIGKDDGLKFAIAIEQLAVCSVPVSVPFNEVERSTHRLILSPPTCVNEPKAGHSVEASFPLADPLRAIPYVYLRDRFQIDL